MCRARRLWQATESNRGGENLSAVRSRCRIGGDWMRGELDHFIKSALAAKVAVIHHAIVLPDELDLFIKVLPLAAAERVGGIRIAEIGCIGICPGKFFVSVPDIRPDVGQPPVSVSRVG